MAVWRQHDGSNYKIWANRYNSAGNTWDSPTVIEGAEAGDALDAHIAVDDSNNAVAIWRQYDGTRFDIYSNRYSAAGNSWGAATLIESGDGEGLDPKLAVDGSGNAVAVWYQNDGDQLSIYANRYSMARNSWSSAELIELQTQGPAFFPEVAVDTEGNALVVWYQSDGVQTDIWANRYDVETGSWQDAELLDEGRAGNATSPKLATDAQGNAVCVWLQREGEVEDVWAAQYDAITQTWGAGTVIEGEANTAGPPNIAVDDSGNAIAVWHQSDGIRDNIWASRYNALMDSWTPAELIEGLDVGGAASPRVGVDANGNAVVVWVQFDGTQNSVWANRLR